MTLLSTNNIQRVFSSFIFILTISLFYSQYSFAELPEKQVFIERVNDLKISDMTPGTVEKTRNLTLVASGNKFDLVLEPNTALLKKFTQSSTSTQTLYKGVIKGNSDSWVRLSDIDGIYAGAVFDGNELFIVDSAGAIRESLSVSQLERFDAVPRDTQIIYKASDITNTGVCGLEQHNHSNSNFNYQEFVKDLTLMTASSATRELDVALVADYPFNQDYNGNAEQRMLLEMNMVDGIFSEQVNVHLSIVSSGVLAQGVLNVTDPVDLVYDFRDYVFSEIGNPGVTHLFTGNELDDNVLGIAFVAELCSSYGVGLSQNYGSSTFLVAAHELGHNFGAPHDNQSGSACSSTAGNRLMNPGINGSDQFSNCSLTQMNAHIDYVNSQTGGSCVAAVQPVVAPTISSIADLNATVGFAYNYDADNTIGVSGSTPILYTLDTFPTGMSITQEGLISWTPTAQQVGSNTVQITVSNSAGSDSQTFDVFVWEPISEDLDVLDFNTSPPSSYGSEEDTVTNGIVTVENGGATLAMSGNRWQQVSFQYEITANTVLEFEFRSTIEAEIHGIGFDNDLANSAENTFSVFGTELWGIQDYRYNGDGEFEKFTIPVGQYYTGEMQYLFFVLDHDIAEPTGNAYFKNIKVYEALLSVEIAFPDALENNQLPADEVFSVEATVSNDSNTELETVEFSLDQENWTAATKVNDVYRLDSFGPVAEGAGEFYVRLNGTTIQTVAYTAAARPIDAEIGYYFVNPNWVGTEVNIFAINDNTHITIDGIQQSLNKGDSISYTIATTGEYIFANKMFSVGSEADGLDLPVPTSFLGTDFVIPHVRYTHYYHLLSPEQDTQVNISLGNVDHQVQLTAGNVYTFDAGTTNKIIAGLIRADHSIVVAHTTDRNSDTYPVPPVALELWGIRSTRSYVSALEDETEVSIYSSDGDVNIFTIDAGELIESVQTTSSTQGKGNAIRIVANKPISAIQHADGDGVESTGFWPITEFSSEFLLPVDAQYLAIACSVQTTVTLYNAAGEQQSESNCSAQGSFAGKVYLENVAAGSSIRASNPIYLIYETESFDEERNLLGIQGSIVPITLSYEGLEQFTEITSASDFIAQAIPNNAVDFELISVEFSIDGENWFEAEYVNGIYQYNFNQLQAGQYTLFARLNGSSVISIAFEVATAPTIFEFGYYFLDQKWVNKEATIYAITDNTALLINGNTINLNKNESLTYTVTHQGQLISSNVQFSVGAHADALDLPVPVKFIGNQFIVPNIRKTNYYNLLSPDFDTMVDVQVGLNNYSLSLIAGEVYTFSTKDIDGETGRIESVLPILVSHSTVERSDSYPVPPTTTELWGVRSKFAHITAFEDNTNVTVYADTGELESFIVDAGEVVVANIGSNSAEGQGSALRVIADNPIAAVQFADTDGAESTSFWASEYFATNFVLPVPTQYVAVVCPVTTAISLYSPSGTLVATETCIANSDYPGKAYFGSATDGENIAVGSSLEADDLIYLIYESSEENDERNLAGYNALVD